MNLSKEQLYRMTFLLGKSKYIGLTVEEKTELTNLILIEDPIVSGPLENIIKLGLIIVGISVIYQYAKQQLCDSVIKNLDMIDTNTQLENMGFFR